MASLTIADLPPSCLLIIVKTLCYREEYGGYLNDNYYCDSVYSLFLAIPSVYMSIKPIPAFRCLEQEAKSERNMTLFYDHWY